MVSRLYMEWEDCLMQSLNLRERIYFESICNETTTDTQLAASLFLLTTFLFKKFRRKVIVLIDEYETPNNRAYDKEYFNQVRVLYPYLCPLVLRTRIPGQ